MYADRKIRQLLAERRAVFNQVTELTNRVKHAGPPVLTPRRPRADTPAQMWERRVGRPGASSHRPLWTTGVRDDVAAAGPTPQAAAAIRTARPHPLWTPNPALTCGDAVVHSFHRLLRLLRTS